MCPIHVGYLTVLFSSSSQYLYSHDLIFSCLFHVSFTPLPKIYKTPCGNAGTARSSALWGEGVRRLRKGNRRSHVSTSRCGYLRKLREAWLNHGITEKEGE